MARMIHWIEVACDYDGCDWYSDTLRPGEGHALWRQYRKHKRKAHPEKCAGCRFLNDIYRCGEDGCTEGRKKVSK